jgi:hypothetical protein
VANDPWEEPSDSPGAGAYRRTSGLATTSLVLGIVGLVTIPLLASIAAIVVGKAAQQEIARTPDLEGEGSASAGIILGWIGVALAVVVLLLLVVAVSCVTSSGPDVTIGAP